MKKLQLLAILTLSLFFVLSCTINDDDDFVDTYSGDDTDTLSDTLPDNQQDSDTDADTATDTDPDTTADTDSDTTADTDADTATDTDPDTTADTDSDTTADTDADTATDTDADTTADTGSDTDADTELPDNLPECTFTDNAPCKDSSSGFVWSSKLSAAKYWNDAVGYCDGLNESGLSWRMPEIYELRTLIENCSSTQISGSCQITEGCVAYNTCNTGCDSCSGQTGSGYYSKVGDADTLWSATKVSDYSDYWVWTLNFKSAGFSQGDYKATSGDDKYHVRCIKK